MAGIRTILGVQRRQLARLVEARGVGRLRGIYSEALGELESRLQDLVRRGRGGSFQAHHVRQMLLQAGVVIREFEAQLGGQLRMGGRIVAATAPAQLLASVSALEDHFRGHNPVAQVDQAALFRRVYAGVEPSLMDRFEVSRQLYGPPTIAKIRDKLALGVVQGRGVDEVVTDVTRTFGRERWRAERIVRTEMAYAHNVTQYASQIQLAQDGGPTHKMLIETLDDRTGEDSKVLNGQVRRIDEPFVYTPPPGKKGYPPFQMPPGRPNDRAVVVPWRPEWPRTAQMEPFD